MASMAMEPVLLPEGKELKDLVTRRIHVMGLGSIGTFIAHGLRHSTDQVPITLLMHRQNMYDNFSSNGSTVSVVNIETGENVPRQGYDVDLLEKRDDSGLPHWKFIDEASKNTGSFGRVSAEIMESGESYIHNLIVTVKGPATKAALESVKHRLDSRSTICLIQNGMGQVDELNKEIFPDPKTRPNYLLGIISYGVYLASDNLEAVHAGYGTTFLSIARDVQGDQEHTQAKNEFQDLKPSSEYMLRTLAQPPVFQSSVYKFQDLLQLQLQKLCMNAVMNPLTAILNFHNGYLLNNEPLSHVHRQLLSELSDVIRHLPEFKDAPNIDERFSLERLQDLLVDTSTKTARNSSSMREDVQNQKNTEIEYINGYVVRRGEELGIECAYNRMLLQLVKAKTQSQRAIEAAESS